MNTQYLLAVMVKVYEHYLDIIEFRKVYLFSLQNVSSSVNIQYVEIFFQRVKVKN